MIKKEIYKMTRKDYITLAGIFSISRLEIENLNIPEDQKILILKEVKNIISNLGGVLAEDNHRFDYQRFLTACKYNDISYK